jgi:hypothetical protein
MELLKNSEYFLIIENDCESSNKSVGICKRFNLNFTIIYKKDLSKEELNIMTPSNHKGVVVIYQDGQYLGNYWDLLEYCQDNIYIGI